MTCGFPSQNTSNAQFWCFLRFFCSVLFFVFLGFFCCCFFFGGGASFEQITELYIVWDAATFKWRHCYVFSSDQPVSPKIHGLQSTFTVGQQPEVTCHLDYFWTESVSFVWSIDDIELPARTEQPVNHANNIATFSSTLLYNFERSDELKDIVCLATVDKMSASDSVALDMQCKQTNICTLRPRQNGRWHLNTHFPERKY